ncbi:MAG: B-box zinc finger protein, partial [Candidatus Ranarchaeia archaeon]
MTGYDDLYNTVPKSCESCHNHHADYLCEKCSTALCFNCLKQTKENFPVCVQCGNNNIEDKEEKHSEYKEDNKLVPTCVDCGSINIQVATRMVRVCPHCGSTHVISIDQKIKEINRRLRESSSNLMFGYVVLQDLYGGFNQQKHALIQLRNSGMHHNPSLESSLLQIHQIVPRLQLQIIEEVKKILDEFRYSTNHIPTLSNPDPKNIKSLEQSIETLERDIDQNRKLVLDILNFPQQTLSEIEKFTNEMKKHLEIYFPLQDVFPLKHAEHLIACIHGIRIQDTPEDVDSEKTSGTLILTDRRIGLIRLKGVIRRTHHIILDQDLETDSLIEEHGALRKA